MAKSNDAKIAEYEDAGVMFILKRENGQLYEAKVPIPKWYPIGDIKLRSYENQSTKKEE